MAWLGRDVEITDVREAEEVCEACWRSEICSFQVLSVDF
jgi:hypothetical protein